MKRLVVQLKYLSCINFLHCTHLPDEGMAIIAIPCEDGFWCLIFNGDEVRDLVRKNMDPVREENFIGRQGAIIKTEKNGFSDKDALINIFQKKVKNIEIQEINGNDPLRWQDK